MLFACETGNFTNSELSSTADLLHDILGPYDQLSDFQTWKVGI